MKAVIQRVDYAKVAVNETLIGEIAKGLLVFLGVGRDDGEKDADFLADKTMNLRIFEDCDGKMNRSLLEVSGDMLIVSQFTLFADCRKGRRPSFIDACEPERAIELYEYFVQIVREQVSRVATGQFQAMMKIELVNHGPVTMILDSKQNKKVTSNEH